MIFILHIRFVAILVMYYLLLSLVKFVSEYECYFNQYILPLKLVQMCVKIFLTLSESMGKATTSSCCSGTEIRLGKKGLRVMAWFINRPGVAQLVLQTAL